MTLLATELRLGLPELARAVFVALPFLILVASRGRKARAADIALGTTLFLSHFFFGVLSAFLFYWMQLLLWILAREPRRKSELRRSRAELVRGLSTGLAFLIALTYSGHLATLAWSAPNADAPANALFPALTLVAVFAGMLIQLLRPNRETDPRGAFGEAILTYASFRMLLVYFDDFAAAPLLRVLLPVAAVGALGFLAWAESRRSQLNVSRTWFGPAGTLVLFGLVLRDRALLELFAGGWFFFAALEALARAELRPSKVTRAIFIAIRASTLLGVVGLSRPLFLLVSEALASTPALQGLFYVQALAIEAFGFLWLWREVFGEPAYSAPGGGDWKSIAGVVILLAVNPFFLIGTFPVSSEFSVSLPYSLFPAAIFRPEGAYRIDSLLWQTGVCAIAILLSALRFRFKRDVDHAIETAARGVAPAPRRRPGSLFTIEGTAIRASALRLRLPFSPAIPTFRWPTIENERLRTQAGFALVFLVFLWFLLGKAV